MNLLEDRNGLESIPLKLMIVVIVASLSVVPAGQALEGFRNRDFVARAELALESIISTAQSLMIDGPGGVRTLHLDFEGAGHTRFESVSIGDCRGGPNMSAVILHLAGGASIIRTATEPEIWIRAPSGGALMITYPVCDLRLSTQLSDRAAFVLAELV
jgi:hypothetical protein